MNRKPVRANAAPSIRGTSLSETQGNEQRQLRIIEMIGKQGFLTLEALVRNFGVTVQTIRRDVNMLATEGRLSLVKVGHISEISAL